MNVPPTDRHDIAKVWVVRSTVLCHLRWSDTRSAYDRWMSSTPSPAPLEHLSGAIERVTFHSPDSGFCVLRVKVRGERDLITVIGSAASITPGEFLEAEGVWVNDRQHGLQFKSLSLRVIPPSTLDGIEKYLGSGMVKQRRYRLVRQAAFATLAYAMFDFLT